MNRLPAKGPRLRRLASICAALLFVGLATVGIAFWQAQQPPIIVRYTVALPGLERPLTIGQISDAHAGWDMPASRLAAAADRLARQKPDLVVLTGDFISGNPDDWSLAETHAALAPLQRLHAPLGVFAVTGNHDDPRKLRRLLAGTDIRFLHDAAADTGPLWLVGAREYSELGRPVETLRALVRRLPRSKPMVVVAHRPDFFQWLDPPVGLLIAGHSHGGQILVPGLTNWIIGGFVGDHLRGVYQENGRALVVSSGLGTTAVPLRLFVPPEIVLIRLVPARSATARQGQP